MKNRYIVIDWETITTEDIQRLLNEAYDEGFKDGRSSLAIKDYTYYTNPTAPVDYKITC